MMKLFRSVEVFKLAVYAVFFVSIIGSGASLAAQYLGGMNPCVMCIQQRIALMLLAPVALICFYLNKTTLKKTIAAILISAPAIFGLFIAIKQIHLQSLPPMEQPSCGAPWTFVLRHAPLFDWYEPIIRGTGACGEVYHVLGVALPIWSALFFSAVLLFIWAAWAISLKNNKTF